MVQKARSTETVTALRDPAHKDVLIQTNGTSKLGAIQNARGHPQNVGPDRLQKLELRLGLSRIGQDQIADIVLIVLVVQHKRAVRRENVRDRIAIFASIPSVGTE